jgi:hypothetical protein
MWIPDTPQGGLDGDAWVVVGWWFGGGGVRCATVHATGHSAGGDLRVPPVLSQHVPTRTAAG